MANPPHWPRLLFPHLRCTPILTLQTLHLSTLLLCPRTRPTPPPLLPQLARPTTHRQYTTPLPMTRLPLPGDTLLPMHRARDTVVRLMIRGRASLRASAHTSTRASSVAMVTSAALFIWRLMIYLNTLLNNSNSRWCIRHIHHTVVPAAVESVEVVESLMTTWAQGRPGSGRCPIKGAGTATSCRLVVIMRKVLLCFRQYIMCLYMFIPVYFNFIKVHVFILVFTTDCQLIN